MEERICIICRELKTEFNREHVFPETVGGQFVIDLVCKDCNSLLGRTVDTPFANHKEILLARHHYEISRNDRDIRNPFTDTEFVDGDGYNIFITLNEDGKFEALRKPDFEITETENGPIGKLIVSGKLCTDKMMLRYQKEFEEKTGLAANPEKPKTEIKTSPMQVTLIDSASKIIWGCLKIGYETAVACLPEYLNDPLAIALSGMLKTHEFDRSLESYFNPMDLTDGIAAIIDRHPNMHRSHCFVVIMNLEGRGLVCMVKVFGIYYPFILSQRLDYIDNRLLVILNNSVQKLFGCSIIKTANAFEFGLEKELIRNDSDPANPFVDGAGLIPLYNVQGNKIMDHVERFAIQSFSNQAPETLAQLQSMKFFLTDGHYLLSSVNNSLHKVVEITLLY